MKLKKSMMNIKFVLIAFLFSVSSIAQFTLIPDSMFEKMLIAQGIDSGVPDGKVLTASINTLTTLNISNQSDPTNRITNLTGIEDFIALENLDCSYNLLTAINISNNTKLETLVCQFNDIATLNVTNNTLLKTLNIDYNKVDKLDVSKNTLLELLNCTFNKLSSLNLSKNTNLIELVCSYNTITELDLSKSTQLIYLDCFQNSLVNINLKNGNNLNLRYNSAVKPNSNFRSNTNLVCITVDDVNYSNSNWGALKELSTQYTTIASPSPVIQSPQTFCSSNSPTIADIIITTGSNLNWYSFPAFGNSLPSNTALVDGATYYASQNSGGCNSARTAVKITIQNNNAPTPTIANLPNITGDCHTVVTTFPTATDSCLGLLTATTTSPLTYTTAGEYTIVWNYNAGKLNATTQNQKVIISTQPLPVATANQTFCAGQNQTVANIVTSSGTNLKWYNVATNGSPISTATLLVNGSSYYVSQTINGCESDRTSVTVIVEDVLKPVPTLASLPDINGDCHTVITTIPTATDNCAGLISATTANTLIYNLPGEYKIIWNFNDGNGNRTTQEQKVFISTVPVPVITPPGLFCIQQNATLGDITVAGQNIKWYDAVNGTNPFSFSHVLINNTTYYAVQTINGCESKKVAIEAKVLNTHPVTGNTNQSFCSDTNPTIASIVATGSAIKWYDRNSLPIPTSTTIVNGATYFATQTISGCESQTKLAVNTTIIAALITNDYEDTQCDDLSEGIKTVNLTDYNAKLTTINTGYTFDYYHSKTGAENETFIDKITDFASYRIYLGENKIYVRINSNTVCSAVVVLKIDLFALPEISIASVMPICDKTPLSISAGINHDTYTWSTGDSTPAITTNIPGDYWVEVGKNHRFLNCYNKTNFKLIPSSKAVISKIDTAEWTDNKNAITINATGTGSYKYSIDGEVFQDSNQFTDLINGRKIVFIKDTNGCKTVTEEVFLLMYPRFFTPNGDGFNDNWEIKFLDFEKERTIVIYDRNGKLIKTLTSSTEIWDGKFNGSDLPADDYWFIVTSPDEKEIKGHFSLKR